MSNQEEMNLEQIKGINVPIKVRIAKKTLRLKDLEAIDVNTIIDTDKAKDEPLELFVGDKLFAYGRAVVVDSNFGFQITEIVGTSHEEQH